MNGVISEDYLSVLNLTSQHLKPTPDTKYMRIWVGGLSRQAHATSVQFDSCGSCRVELLASIATVLSAKNYFVLVSADY